MTTGEIDLAIPQVGREESDTDYIVTVSYKEIACQCGIAFVVTSWYKEQADRSR